MTAFTNRKKIRGWRKQILKINKWFNRNKFPDITALDNWRDEYVKIWIDPWYRLEKRNPPLWYFRKVLDNLNEMYDLWDKEFIKGKYPYDLQVWIFENKIIESELVAARVDNKGERRTNFFFKCDENRPFPIWRFKSKKFDPSDFYWTLSYATYQYFQKQDDLSQEEISKLIKEGYKEDLVFKGQENEQKYYWKPYDYVWIGRKKK